METMDMISACFEAAQQHAELDALMNVDSYMNVDIYMNVFQGVWLFMWLVIKIWQVRMKNVTKKMLK